MNSPSKAQVIESIRSVLSANCNEADPDDEMMWVNVAERSEDAYRALLASAYPFGDIITEDSRLSPLDLVLARAILLQYFESIGIDWRIDRFAATQDLPSFADIHHDVLITSASCGEKAHSVLIDLILHYGFARRDFLPPSPSMWLTLQLLGMSALAPFAAKFSSSIPGSLASKVRTASELSVFARAVATCRHRFRETFTDPCIPELLCHDLELWRRSSVARDLLMDCDPAFVLAMLSRPAITGDDFCQLGALLAETEFDEVDQLIKFVLSGVRPFGIFLEAVNHIFGVQAEHISGTFVPGARVMVRKEHFDRVLQEAKSVIKLYRPSLDARQAELARYLMRL